MKTAKRYQGIGRSAWADVPAASTRMSGTTRNVQAHSNYILPLLRNGANGGYGLLFGITALFIRKRFPQRQMLRDAAAILLIASAYVVFFGILYGEFFGDLLYRGQLGLAFRGDLKGIMFIIENICYAVPLIILMKSESRNRPSKLFVSAIFMMLAGAVYRFNAFIIGFDPGQNWHYFPSFSETMITVGLIALEIMAYLLFIKRLPVLPDLGKS